MKQNSSAFFVFLCYNEKEGIEIMKIGFASDHRGYALKEYLKQALLERNYEVLDFGTNQEESVDYPDFAFALGESVSKKETDFGVAICGSGIGISIACNKVKGIRCAKVSTIEEAKITRNDNDSNIIALSETTPAEEALQMILSFLATEFSSEEKHHRRVEKIKQYEEQ